MNEHVAACVLAQAFSAVLYLVCQIVGLLQWLDFTDLDVVK